MNFLNKISNAAGALMQAAGRTFEINKPQIAIAGGLVLIVAGAVIACEKTYHADEIIEKHNEVKDKIELASENPEYDQNMKVKDTVRLYINTAKDFAKLYAIPISCFGAGIYLILYSNGLMKSRNAALMAYAKGLEAAYSKLEERLKEEVGGEKANEIIYDTKSYDDIKDKAEEAGLSDVKINGNEPSIYERFFDENSCEWKKDANYNRAFLTGKMRWLNTMLRASNEIFISLNTVLEELGFEKIYPFGEMVGWYRLKGHPVYGDTIIDFGLGDPNEATTSFMNGSNRYVLIRFNCNLMDWNDIASYKRLSRAGIFKRKALTA